MTSAPRSWPSSAPTGRSSPGPAGPGRPRVVAGRVIVPLDAADAAARRKYRDYQASRHQRTLAPIGERRILIALDSQASEDFAADWDAWHKQHEAKFGEA
jgi:hypothetical protein